MLLLVKIPWLKKNCETARYRDSETSSFVAKVRGEVLVYFRSVAVKRRTVFVNNPLDAKEIDEHALRFAPHLSRLFRSG
jgi:hypothetical protein